MFPAQLRSLGPDFESVRARSKAMRQSLLSTGDGIGNDSVSRKFVVTIEHNIDTLFTTAELGMKPDVRANKERIQSKNITTLDKMLSTYSSWALSGAMASQSRLKRFKVQLS